MSFTLPDEAATLQLAGRFYAALPQGGLVFLRGQLGAGKTAFVRGCLRAAGYQGAVKSPTYTLVEEYALDGRTIYHFDLYRLADAEELEWVGIRDYLRPDALCFIEWPERGAGVLPPPDIDLSIGIHQASRIISFQAYSSQGRKTLDRMENKDK